LIALTAMTLSACSFILVTPPPPIPQDDCTRDYGVPDTDLGVTVTGLGLAAFAGIDNATTKCTPQNPCGAWSGIGDAIAAIVGIAVAAPFLVSSIYGFVQVHRCNGYPPPASWKPYPWATGP
jgi:hypothetical protein